MSQALLWGEYNPKQNIWNKGDKSGKIGQDLKILISTFASFSTVIAKVYGLGYVSCQI